jgi:pSer/pThr/pTyr-binding forkhead associated (FHA) protein
MSFLPRPHRYRKVKSKHANPARSARVPARTVTISFHGIGGTNHGPALGLRTLDGDKLYAFQAFKTSGRQKRMLTVGASEENDMVIEDEAISRVHCLIHWQRRRVFVRDCGSKNGVWLDGVRVQSGELHPQSTLTLGRTTLVAYGAGKDQGANVKAGNPDQLLFRAITLYGSIRAASRGIGMAYSTLRDKFEKLTGEPEEPTQRKAFSRGKDKAAQGPRSTGSAEATPAKHAGARAARSRRGRARRRR